MVPLETRPGSPHASTALYRYPAMMMQHVTAMLWGHDTACAHTTKHLIWPGQGAVAVRSDLRVDSRFAPSQWDMALLCNISHWQGADLVSALYLVCFVQDCSNSIALAMELLLSCTKPSIYELQWKRWSSKPYGMNLHFFWANDRFMIRHMLDMSDRYLEHFLLNYHEVNTTRPRRW